MGATFFFLFIPMVLTSAVLWLVLIGAVLVLLAELGLYLFQSFGLLRIAKKEGFRYPYLVWLPAVSHYYLGKCCMKNLWSLIYALLTAANLLLPLVAGLLSSGTLISVSLWYSVAYFIVDMVVMHRFYARVYKVPELYTIFTVLTLGILKPIFIFTSRIPKITRVNW